MTFYVFSAIIARNDVISFLYKHKKQKGLEMIKERLQKASNRLKLLDALNQMGVDLKNLGPVPNNVEYISVRNNYLIDGERKLPIPKDDAIYDYAIRFFNITTAFQDKHLLKDGLLHDTESFDIFKKHIYNTGRQMDGWVRSHPGEKVTEDNVFLGNVFGIWTFNISKFKEFDRRHSEENNEYVQNDRNFTKWSVQIYQLQDYLKSHVQPMQDLIHTMLAKEHEVKTGVIDGVFNKIAIVKQNRQNRNR